MTAAPTSTRSGAFSTSSSPDSRPFRATPSWRSCSRTRTLLGPGPPRSAPGLPPAIDDVVAKAMAKRPEERYGSAGELAAAAATALGEPAPASAAGAATCRVARRATAPDAAAAPSHPAPAAAGDRSPGGDRRGRGRRRSWRSPAGMARTGSRRPAHSRRPEATIKVGEDPTGITVGGTNVWVASTGAHAVDAIDPANRASRARRSPSAAADLGRRRLRLDLGRQSQRDTVDAARPGRGPDRRSASPSATSQPTSRSATGGYGSPTEATTPCRGWIPRRTGSTQTVHVGAGPRAVATGEGGVWVANIDGQVRVEDRSSGGEDGRPSDRRSASGRTTWPSASARSG